MYNVDTMEPEGTDSYFFGGEGDEMGITHREFFERTGDRWKDGGNIMVVWVGVGILVLFYELYAIITKEDKLPTLSRTIWKLTSWEVTLLGPRYTTIKPLRIALFFFMVWLTIHLAFGPCALGVC